MDPPPGSDTSFDIDIRRRPNCVVVHLAGSCTMEVCDRLESALRPLMKEPVRLIVMELSRLDFIESTGLGAIVAAYLRLRRRHGEVRIVRPRPAILKLLELTRLTQIFSLHESVENAENAPLASGRP